MGTEEFWVPAVLAAASAGGQYVNTRNAQNRENNATIAGIKDQQDIQSQGVAAARALTDKISRDNPNQIASKATGDYVSQLRRNAAGSTQPGASSALAPVAGGSARYNAGKDASQSTVENYGNTYAGEMGNLDAATRLRQNEGLDMQDLGTSLNTLGAKSATTGFVDQLRAAAAGQPNPWVTLGSNLIGGLAKAYSLNGVGSKIGSTGAGLKSALANNTVMAGPDSASAYTGSLA